MDALGYCLLNTVFENAYRGATAISMERGVQFAVLPPFSARYYHARRQNILTSVRLSTTDVA